jgi:hypothetical protein
MGTDYEYWQQLKNQAKRVYEEAKELLEAVEAEDMQQVLDGFLDVRYTNEYMEDLLVAGEVDTKKSWESVCNNNDQKFTTSYTYAMESKEALEAKGVECYVDQTQYEGEIYYVCRRDEDNKVLKLKHHESPDLSLFVPEEFK